MKKRLRKKMVKKANTSLYHFAKLYFPGFKISWDFAKKFSDMSTFTAPSFKRGELSVKVFEEAERILLEGNVSRQASVKLMRQIIWGAPSQKNYLIQNVVA